MEKTTTESAGGLSAGGPNTHRFSRPRAPRPGEHPQEDEARTAVGPRPDLEALAVDTGRRLGGIELGVDLVVDRQGQPHVIEVNAKPTGRLEKLGHRFAEAHLQACIRPIRFLWERYSPS